MTSSHVWGVKASRDKQNARSKPPLCLRFMFKSETKKKKTWKMCASAEAERARHAEREWMSERVNECCPDGQTDGLEGTTHGDTFNRSGGRRARHRKLIYRRVRPTSAERRKHGAGPLSGAAGQRAHTCASAHTLARKHTQKDWPLSFSCARQ